MASVRMWRMTRAVAKVAGEGVEGGEEVDGSDGAGSKVAGSEGVAPEVGGCDVAGAEGFVDVADVASLSGGSDEPLHAAVARTTRRRAERISSRVMGELPIRQPGRRTSRSVRAALRTSRPVRAVLRRDTVAPDVDHVA